MSEINVVPYIDVMLVLLVIFMVTTPMLTQGIKVDLPKVSNSPPVPQPDVPPVTVGVKANGSFELQKGSRQPERVTAEELKARVLAERQLNPNTPIYLGGDANAAYEKVAQALDMLNKAGVEGVGLLTAPREP